MLLGRYEKNGIFSDEEMNKIIDGKFAVIGSGGLGGYLLEMLARLGVGELTVVDGDVFDETNLNRQILSDVSNLGQPKSLEAEKRLKRINPDIKINVVQDFLNEGNAGDIIRGNNIVLDALDSVKARLVLEETCEKEGIPLVHGAIAGWNGQVTTVLPGDRTLSRLYKDSPDKGIETATGNPSFTPATIASIQVSEAIKVYLGKEDILRCAILYIDLLYNQFFTLELKG